jgi:hypothetical protein
VLIIVRFCFFDLVKSNSFSLPLHLCGLLDFPRRISDLPCCPEMFRKEKRPSAPKKGHLRRSRRQFIAT